MTEMKLERLREILDAYGADARRWPEAERGAALELVARGGKARALRDDAARLDALLDMAPAVALQLDALRVAVAADNVHRFPARRRNGSVAIGWPSFAGLAAAAAAGFVVGWLNLAAIGGLDGVSDSGEVSETSAGFGNSEVQPW
jgi:hypothetical protein